MEFFEFLVFELFVSGFFLMFFMKFGDSCFGGIWMVVQIPRSLVLVQLWIYGVVICGAAQVCGEDI